MVHDNDSTAAPLAASQIEKFRAVASLVVGAIALVGILVGVGGTFVSFWTGTTRPDMHPLQIMALFFASGGALILISIFRTTDGPIELKLGFIEFKGASGPIIMWVVVFMSICAGMKILNLAG